MEKEEITKLANEFEVSEKTIQNWISGTTKPGKLVYELFLKKMESIRIG